jgi:LmbE family N-acetylglucosaminyl deacetylase
MKKILLVLAHPDDESFPLGGTIAKYVSAGWRVDLITATKGEAGDPGLYSDTIDLGTVREKELAEAAKELGIASVTHLGYTDGKLSAINPGELEEVIYQQLALHRPDIVFTYETNGISNHPDHIKMSLSTTYAFHKYAASILEEHTLGSRDPKRYLLRQEEPSGTLVEPKLYYACMPESIAEYLRKKNVIHEESFGKPQRGVPDKLITTVIDISKFKTKKINALRKHVSQQADVDRFLSISNQPLVRQEYFILRYIGKQEVFMGNNDRISNKL